MTRFRRAGLLLSAAALAAAAVVAAVPHAAAAAPTLKSLADAQGRDIGFALDPGRLSEAAYKSIADTEFNLVVGENAMKWDATEPTQGQFRWTGADAVASYAQSTAKKLYRHTLVWHSQLPSWVSALGADQLRAAMTSHISTVVGRYKGQVTAWDVVNEAFADGTGGRRGSVFQQKLGDGYIAEAFRAARAADPAAKLCINDYNTDGVNAKSTAIYNLVRDFKAQGVPIDCVGFQAHLIIGQVPGDLRQNLQRFADLGVDVRITELDIRMNTPADATKLAQQASDYAAVVRACLAVSRCRGVTTWGITDKYSWVPGVFSGQGAALLWDDNYAAKPAYQAVATALGAPVAAAGITVSGGRIIEATGDPFVMRGVNHAHTWYQDRTPTALADIKSLKANTVRVVLSSGQRWTRNDVANVSGVIAGCKANKLICVLEVHDTTGYGEESAAATLAQAVDYWISVKSALDGQEAYVILNIGNEPWGNTGASGWTSATTGAIGRLRTAGFRHAIMVDAPNWGQDWQFIMRDNAAAVFASDPQRNTIFSIHMYGVFDTAAEIDDYLGRFQSAGLPIVVGEFGYNHSDGNPDEDAILASAQSRGIGYLGWSWSGNGGGVEYLDLVTNFDLNQLTSWGQRLFNGANGIAATSREARIYGGTTTPPPPPPPPPPSKSCTAAYAVGSQWGGGFQGTVTVTAGTSAITSWTVTWTWPSGQRFTNTWNAQVTTNGDAITARNASYNGSLAAGASTSWGFTASSGSTNTAPTAACAAA